MARQIVPTDKPARLIFPAGTHVKVTNTGEQIVWISDVESGLYQVDPASGTPLTGMPLSPGSTETWWGPDGLWVLTPLPGGEVEYSFSGAASMQEPTQRDLPFPSRAIEPGFPLVRMPQTEATSVLLPGLRGKFILRMIILALALMPLARAQTSNPGSAPRVLFPGLNVINPSFQLSTANSPLYVNVTYPPNATSAGLIVNGAIAGSGGSSSNSNTPATSSGSVTQSGANCTWAAGSGTLTSAVSAIDGISDSCTLTTGATNTLLLQTFGFSVPTNATITGVQAQIRARGTALNNLSLSTVQLLKAGVGSGTDKGNATFLNQSFTNYFFGGSNDPWGNTLTPTDVNAAGFGIQIIGLSATNSNSVVIDYVSLTVYYSVTTPSTAGTLISYSILQLNPRNTQSLACIVDQFLSMSRCPIPQSGKAQIQLTAAAGSPQQIAMYVFVFTGADMLRPGYSQYNPAQLGMNSITLPISGSTAESNIIDTRGVKEATFTSTCTQIAFIAVTHYNEDGSGAFSTQITTGTATTQQVFHIGSEQSPQSNQTIAANWLEFPQRAISFHLNNGTAVAGACTARLLLEY